MTMNFEDSVIQNSKTEHQTEFQYPFCMREVERNIVYYHQKYKKYKKRTLSETKQAPSHFKSTKTTAIEFQQIHSFKKTEVPCTTGNGFLLFAVIQKLRAKEDQQKNKIKRMIMKKQLDEKLGRMRAVIEAKKAEKKDQEKKENKHYKRMMREHEKNMQIHSGMVKALKKTHKFGFELNFIGLKYPGWAQGY